jgi:hypothetical protein
MEFLMDDTMFHFDMIAPLIHIVMADRLRRIVVTDARFCLRYRCRCQSNWPASRLVSH